MKQTESPQEAPFTRNASVPAYATAPYPDRNFRGYGFKRTIAKPIRFVCYQTSHWRRECPKFKAIAAAVM